MVNKTNTGSNNKKIIIYIVLTLATLAVYWQASRFDFINFDDPVYIMESSYVKSGTTLEGIRWAFMTKHTGLWYPLVWLSFMVDYQIYGLHPGGYHVTNLIFHILSTLLLFWLFCRMTGAVWKSAFVAAFFALHPLHVESVAWIAERKDVLSAFFWMVTLCFYVYYTEKPVIKRYLLVLFAFVLALMSKPMVVTLPLIMILLDYWPLERFASRQSNFLWQVKEKLPLFILSLIIVMITIYHPNSQYLSEFPLVSRMANAPVAFITYLVKTLWPYNMAIFYPFPTHIPAWQILASTILMTIITISVIFMAGRLPHLFVGWMWYTIIILPVLGIIQISLYAMADHYHYLPSIGIAVMLAWGIPPLLPHKYLLNKILFPVALVILLVWSVLTWKQCGIWRNSISLLNQTLRVTENNYIAHGHLGGALFTEGKTKEAIDQYNEALRLAPGYFDAYNNRGTAYNQMGQYEKALEDYSIAIRLKPDYADAYHNRGIVHSELGDRKKALEDFSHAILLNPFFASAYGNRAVVYINTGDMALGCRDAQRACELGNCVTQQAANAQGLCR